ncbi:MAG: PBP1A family penicillin-binding protein [Gemmatimonadaceae bacterium]|nr:PBP1A family penicillin-binding protein [Gemmatimonadaceae bacterium]
MPVTARRLARPLALVLASAGPLVAQDPSVIIPLPQSSLVLARDGAVIGEVGRQVRTSVSIGSLPKYLPAAFVAVEDKRFYQHDGVDLVGIAGAVKDALTGDARGASTITQQLVGNMHPTLVDRSDKSIGRKLREQDAARAMERRYSKAQILEAYLNTIHFGHGWYGIDAAARHYFGKPAARVTLAEAATLASMPKGPALYDPVKHPERVRERRNLVLALMAEQGMISASEKAQSQAQPLVTTSETRDEAMRWVVSVARIQAERGGVPLRDGGYRIVTTIDPALQLALAKALREGVAAAETPRKRKGKAAAAPSGTLEGAGVFVSPVTGEVLASVGGRDPDRSTFDRVIDGRRQPGSAFKPFVYAEALRQGVSTAATTWQDSALRLVLPTGKVYSPDNADGKYLGPLTLREALVESRNPVAVQVGQAATIDSVALLARRMGLDAVIENYPSSAIGTASVRPLDMARAYAAFANGGVNVSPRFVLRVEDRAGRTVWTPRVPAPQYALDNRVAYIMRDIMSDVVARGTATSARRIVPARIPVAGKTGTTNGSTDVWFAGMTPDLAGAVWVGYDTPKPIAGGSAAGGTIAAPIWARAVAAYYAGGRAAQNVWSPPPGMVAVDFDRATRAPATLETLPAYRYTEWFVAGTEPGALAIDPWRLFEGGALGR